MSSTRYVTLPFDFEQLPPDRKAAVIPICVERTDRDGAEIAWGWFEAAAGIQDSFRSLAQSWLEDIWRALEIAEGSIHTVWYRHRFDFGRRPESRLLAEAKWIARDLRAGSWQHRRGVVMGLNGLDHLLRSRVLTDPSRYENVYQRELYFKSLGEQLTNAGQEEVSYMLNFVRDGCTWAEIGERLGKDPDAARMKFGRWMKRLLQGRLNPPG